MAIPGNLLSVTTESIDPNTSGWRSRLNCTLGLGAGGRNGDGVLSVQSVAAGEMQAETVTAYPITGGETYFTFADASSAAVPERIGILWLDASGSEISTTWSLTTESASSSLHRVSVAGVAPSSAAKARVVLSSTELGASVSHYWENVYLGLPIRTQGNLLPFQVESGGELDTTGWEAEVNAAVGRLVPAQLWPVTWYLSGGHVMTLTAVAAGDTAMRCTERVVATAGTEYLGYAYLGPPTAGTAAWIEIRFYDEADALLLAERAVLDSPGTGIFRQRVPAHAPAGTVSCEVAVGLTGASAGHVLRVEGVVITVAPEIRAGTVVPYADGAFEQGVGSWTVASGAGTIARTSPWGVATVEGSYALALDSASTGETVLHSAKYPVAELESWRPAIGVQHAAGASSWEVDLGLRWFDETDTEISSSGMSGAFALPTDGGWWTLSDDLTAPAGSDTARIEISATATAASSTLHLDRIGLQQVLPLASAVADPEAASITLTLRELTEGVLITVWRVGEDGQRTLVRGPDGLIESVELTSDLLVVEDYEAPLGVPVSYYAEGYSASTGAFALGRESDPVTITVSDGNYAWLKDPGMPHRNVRVLVHSAAEWKRPIQQAEYRVRGRRNPVVLADVRGGLEGALSIWTEDDDARHALHWLLDSGNTLMLQAAPGYGVEDIYVTVGEVIEARTGGTAREPWRAWTLPLTEADMPTAVGVAGTAGRSWQDVLAENTTWQQVADRYATWEDVLFGTVEG